MPSLLELPPANKNEEATFTHYLPFTADGGKERMDAASLLLKKGTFVAVEVLLWIDGTFGLMLPPVFRWLTARLQPVRVEFS